jgi:hypothetical protein
VIYIPVVGLFHLVNTDLCQFNTLLASEGLSEETLLVPQDAGLPIPYPARTRRLRAALHPTREKYHWKLLIEDEVKFVVVLR